MSDLESTTPRHPNPPETAGPAPTPTAASAPASAPVWFPTTSQAAAPEGAPDLQDPSWPAPPVLGRRLALRAGAAVVAAALAGVAIGIGIIRVRYEDAAPVAAAPVGRPAAPAEHPYGAQSNGTHFGSIRDLLLPMPSGYRPGPDVGAFGNDTELTSDQISSELEDRVKDVPKGQQDRVRAALQAQGHKSAGVRSYRSLDGNMYVSLILDQFNQKSVEAESTISGALGSDSGLFRQGPDVPGHPEAHCFLPPEAPGEQIDELMCTAAVGDLLVSMHVEGVAPLPKAAAVSIFRQQLERLALPGASV